MPDYQANSDKSKQAAQKPPEKKLVKVTTGDVAVKPKSLGSRFKNVFFGGDFNTAAEYVGTEVLLPAIRNLVVDVVNKGIDQLVYGRTGMRRPPRPSYSPRVQYNNPVNRGIGITRAYLPDQRPIDRWQRGTKVGDDVIVASREDADAVVENLTAAVEQYEVVSLADLHDLLGLPSPHTDNKWGWTNLAAVEVRQVRDGWQISFPPLEEIS